MIVINYGLPKSASSFVYQLTARILEAAGHHQSTIREAHLPEELRLHGLPLVHEILRILIDSVPADSKLTIKTHFPLPPLGDLFRHEQVRAIATVRDPRDAILSWMDFVPRHRGDARWGALTKKYPQRPGEAPFGTGLGPNEAASFDAGLTYYLRRCAEAMAWWQAPDVLKVTFDEIYDAPHAVARRIATHVGVDARSVGAVDTDAIVDWFLEDRSRIRQFSSGERSRYRRLMTPTQIARCDSVLGPYIAAFGRATPPGNESNGAGKHSAAPVNQETTPPPRGVSAGPEFDFRSPGKPSFYYVVAATPCSGSTHLCNELWRTGALGAPIEYFNFHRVMIPMLKRLEVETFREYQEKLLSLRTSPNGVFGFKAHFDQWEFFRIAGEFGRPIDLRYILIERQNLVAQAVSFCRAPRPDRREPDTAATRTNVFDYDGIVDAMRELHRQREGWSKWFRDQRITPLHVTYESLIARPAATADGILREFGFKAAPEHGRAAPISARTADPISLRWIERFTKEGLERGIIRRA